MRERRPSEGDSTPPTRSASEMGDGKRREVVFEQLSAGVSR